MLETNIRLVAPGRHLQVDVRRTQVSGTQVTPHALYKACDRLQRIHGLAAVPMPSKEPALLVATDRPVPGVVIQDDNWELTVADAGEHPALTLSTRGSESALPDLLERALVARLIRQGRRWSFGSPRHWYEYEPLDVCDGIAAYRRMAVSGLLVTEFGVGIAAEASVSFLTTDPLSYFFDPVQPPSEQQRRRERFFHLIKRDQGQGTLLYQDGRGGSIKCYFVDAPDGMTCSTTGKVRAYGQSYASLVEYYASKGMTLPPDTPAVRVRFTNIGDQPVAADRVYARLFNDALPRRLQGLGIMAPSRRRELAREFWQEVGERPFGHAARGLLPGFWRPPVRRVWRMHPPALQFGSGRVVPSPQPSNSSQLRRYYYGRLDALKNGGMLSMAPAVNRVIEYAYPERLDPAAARKLAEDMCNTLSDWSGIRFTAQSRAYANLEDGLEKVGESRENGLVLWVLNDEGDAYYQVSLHLGHRRPKRVTQKMLEDHYDFFYNGCWDSREKKNSVPLGRRKWSNFIDLITLDVAQKLNAVPWRMADAGAFEARLAIDVGHKRQHFALSLLIARGREQKPSFEILTEPYHKSDSRQDAINGRMLENEAVKLFKRGLRNGEPLASLLLLRDGLWRGEELPCLQRVCDKLKEVRLLTPDASIEVVEFHKVSLKGVRLWDVDQRDQARNVSEPTAIEITPSMVVLTNTGGTLSQGTAEPVVIASTRGDLQSGALRDATQALHASAQLNWSNPRVAMRLPLEIERTDEVLKSHAQSVSLHIR
jgi:hypothetical protein